MANNGEVPTRAEAQEVIRAAIAHQTLALEDADIAIQRQHIAALLAVGGNYSLLIEAALVVDRVRRAAAATRISGSPSDMLRMAGQGLDPQLVDGCVKLCESLSNGQPTDNTYTIIDWLMLAEDGGHGGLVTLFAFSQRAGQFVLTVDPSVNSWPELIQAEALKMERDYGSGSGDGSGS